MSRGRQGAVGLEDAQRSRDGSGRSGVGRQIAFPLQPHRKLRLVRCPHAHARPVAGRGDGAIVRQGLAQLGIFAQGGRKAAQIGGGIAAGGRPHQAGGHIVRVALHLDIVENLLGTPGAPAHIGGIAQQGRCEGDIEIRLGGIGRARVRRRRHGVARHRQRLVAGRGEKGQGLAAIGAETSLTALAEPEWGIVPRLIQHSQLRRLCREPALQHLRHTVCGRDDNRNRRWIFSGSAEQHDKNTDHYHHDRGIGRQQTCFESHSMLSAKPTES